jgi:anhydro-N-acetylmuramic acid kinase
MGTAAAGPVASGNAAAAAMLTAQPAHPYNAPTMSQTTTTPPSPADRLIAGAMSGTSADGVDVALVRVAGRGLDMTARLVRHHHRAYPPELRREIFSFRGGDATANLARLAQLGREISLAYAIAVSDALATEKLSGADLAAVAAHGQTLYHAPPNTIQWFDPSLVAAHVGCPVVSDFRRADLAAGGQGAPLVPFADYILFRHPKRSRVLLNLGGIANMTYVPAGADIEQLIAFDTGPANCVLDHLARRAGLPGGFDRDGERSLRGEASFATAFVAIRMWKGVFYPPPKSTDGPEMIAAFEEGVATTGIGDAPMEDQLATACVMSALGIDFGLHHIGGRPDEIIASGGGVDNPRLVREVETVAQLPLRRTDDLGVPSQAKEAIAFALLGAATLDGVPSNVPSCTGASRVVVLGSITPKP